MANTSTSSPRIALLAPPLFISLVLFCSSCIELRVLMVGDNDLINGLWFLLLDYWMVLNEILHLCQNSSGSSHALRYMKRNSKNFGGNLSTQKRISYFDLLNDSVEVPCGFFKRFPISDPGQLLLNSHFFREFF